MISNNCDICQNCNWEDSIVWLDWEIAQTPSLIKGENSEQLSTELLQMEFFLYTKANTIKFKFNTLRVSVR